MTGTNSSEINCIKDLLQDINEAGLGTRAYNCLKRGGVYTLKDLSMSSKETLRKLRNMGDKTLAQVTEYAQANGIIIPEEQENSFPWIKENERIITLVDTPVVRKGDVGYVKRIVSYIFPVYYVKFDEKKFDTFSASQVQKMGLGN